MSQEPIHHLLEGQPRAVDPQLLIHGHGNAPKLGAENGISSPLGQSWVGPQLLNKQGWEQGFSS